VWHPRSWSLPYLLSTSTCHVRLLMRTIENSPVAPNSRARRRHGSHHIISRAFLIHNPKDDSGRFFISCHLIPSDHTGPMWFSSNSYLPRYIPPRSATRGRTIRERIVIQYLVAARGGRTTNRCAYRIPTASAHHAGGRGLGFCNISTVDHIPTPRL
jgi:hypothetical protein